MPRSRKTIEEKDLVYLIFASNRCYHKVTDVRPENVTIDLQAGTWSYKREPGRLMCLTVSKPIGSGHHNGDHDGCPIIGVYDRTKITHLNAMIGDSRIVRDYADSRFSKG